MLGLKMTQDERETLREQAARKVMGQILADQYKTDIENKKAQRDADAQRHRDEDRASVQQLVHATDPNNILAAFKDAQSTASGGDVRWRQKGTGDLNFDARMVGMNQQNQPNLVRDAIIREEQRKAEVQKYYRDFKTDGEREKQFKQTRKATDLDWEKRYVTQEVNIFQQNYDRELAKKEEAKRKYAEELKRQYELDRDRKRESNRMTQTEKKINYDNLQVI